MRSPSQAVLGFLGAFARNPFALNLLQEFVIRPELQILFRPRPASRPSITRILRDLPGVQTPDNDFWRVRFQPDRAAVFSHLWRIVARYPDTLLVANDRVQDRCHANATIEWISCLACRPLAGPAGCRLAVRVPGWGCKCLRSVLVLNAMAGGGGPPWWEVGPFQNGVQYIDKADILDALEAEVQARHLELCPHFAWARVVAAVQALPDQIAPRHTDGWIYRGSDDPAQSDYFVGVMPEPHSVRGCRANRWRAVASPWRRLCPSG